jgi:CO/xanthine dehydrogenase Mo-binding subunit
MRRWKGSRSPGLMDRKTVRARHRPQRRGRGIASAPRPASPTPSLAAVNINADGSVTVTSAPWTWGRVGHRDGGDRARCCVATERSRWCTDTDVTPFDMATLGSSSLFHAGNAAVCRPDALQDPFLKKELKLPPDAPVADVFRKKHGMRAGSVTGPAASSALHAARRKRPDRQRHALLMVGASGVELEVDTETGRVRGTAGERG